MASSATAKKAATTGGDSLLFKVKLFFMVFLVVLDIVLNSSVEHDATGMGEVDGESNGTVLALILGSQLVIQVGIFASLFLMMFETYPFRVGLMGMLTSQYLAVYAINVVYLLMTVFVYGYRVTSMVRDNRMGIWEVWDLKGYLPLSILHKIGQRHQRRIFHLIGGQELLVFIHSQPL